METTEELQAHRKAGEEARGQADKVLKDGLKRAEGVCKEAKKQADIVYKEAKILTVDKATKKVADEAHKEALKEAEKLRDAIINEVWVVWHASYDKRAEDLTQAIAKSRDRIDRAENAYEEAKKQADMTYEEARELDVDKAAKKEAKGARKEALKQARKVLEESQK